MQFAVTETQERVEATKGARARCPVCESTVVAKCGAIVVHHWAHEAGEDCDPWFEPETEWHRRWKSLFPQDRVEVPFGDHRADVLTRKGTVVELQNSAISPQDIAARERFYKQMVWVVNAEPFVDRLFVLDRYGSGNLFKLRWKHSRPSWLYARKPVYLDLGLRSLTQVMGQRMVTTSEHPDIPLAKTVARSFHRSRELEPAMQLANILLLNTLHESGWGTVKPLSRESLLGLLSGASKAAVAEPLSALPVRS